MHVVFKVLTNPNAKSAAYGLKNVTYEALCMKRLKERWCILKGYSFKPQYEVTGALPTVEATETTGCMHA